jgi:hypothetical protein
MAEQKKPQDESVLADKDKFKEDANKEKIGHMGDKPNRTPADEPPKK